MFFNHPNVTCGASLRPQNMSLVYGPPQGALENRKDFLFQLGIDYRDLVCAKQAHASNIRCVQESDRGRGALTHGDSIDDTDAFITDRKKLPLAVFTADCLSVFLFDPEKSAIGVVHAGWRGSQKGILGKTIEAMRKEFKTESKDLLAGFGPAIRECCYEVGKEFKDSFSEGLRSKSGRLYLDLAGINRRQLLEAGVKEENITDPGICTSCRNKEYFSYRREGKSCGRMMSVIMLK